MTQIEDSQMENIRKAAEIMAESIQAGRWVHTFGCGHATIPIEEMYPRIGGFVGFHPIVELPLTESFDEAACDAVERRRGGEGDDRRSAGAEEPEVGEDCFPRHGGIEVLDQSDAEDHVGLRL